MLAGAGGNLDFARLLEAFVRHFAPQTEDAVRRLIEWEVKLNSDRYRQNYFNYCGYCVI